MGFLTTITIYDDSLHKIENDPLEFTAGVIEARSTANNHRRSEDLYVGDHHVGIVQVSRHSDENTCYVHQGNTVVEMSEYSSYTELVMKNNPDFFDGMIYQLERTVKELKKKRKELKNK